MTATHDRLGTRPYTTGLHDLGDGAWAWLQPDGGWGWSNAGLLVDGDEALLVDTLYDLRLTGEMLDAMRARVPAAAHIATLVNTHSNGDHCNGNELVTGADIIASAATAEGMADESPQMMASLLEAAPGMGRLGEFFTSCFGAFDFAAVTKTPPTRTFSGRLDLRVGELAVELHEVGPAHTAGDVLVHVPERRTVFTGDILFIGGHPIVWAGPVSNWIAACDLMTSWGVETVVPGHGPVTDLRGVQAVRDYLEWITGEARRRYDDGMDAFTAAKDIPLGDYADWGDAERVVINVDTLFREFSGSTEVTPVTELFARMAEVAR
ncbi:MAG TPA: MBL fold metallo-hydrolase [Acidimicrobiales bacterium]|nr:MBL fold metallo-hydrolase [Acidimicrobiales bacterium]